MHSLQSVMCVEQIGFRQTVNPEAEHYFATDLFVVPFWFWCLAFLIRHSDTKIAFLSMQRGLIDLTAQKSLQHPLRHLVLGLLI